MNIRNSLLALIGSLTLLTFAGCPDTDNLMMRDTGAPDVKLQGPQINPTPQPPPVEKPDGETCSADTECESGHCKLPDGVCTTILAETHCKNNDECLSKFCNIPANETSGSCAETPADKSLEAGNSCQTSAQCRPPEISASTPLGKHPKIECLEGRCITIYPNSCRQDADCIKKEHCEKPDGAAVGKCVGASTAQFRRISLGIKKLKLHFALTAAADATQSLGTLQAICARTKNEVAAGIVLRAGSIVDRIGVLCKDINDLDKPYDTFENYGDVINMYDPMQKKLGGAETGDIKVYLAPPGYALVGFDTRTCVFNGTNVIGRFRPVYKGVSRWGLHQMEIKGVASGELCGSDINAIRIQEISGTEEWNSARCPSDETSQSALVGLANGKAFAHVHNFQGFCQQIDFPENKRPKIKSVSVSDGLVTYPNGVNYTPPDGKLNIADRCSSGVIQSFSARTNGDNAYEIAANCSDISPSLLETGGYVPEAKFNTDDHYAAAPCHTGYAMNGIEGYQGPLLKGVTFSCGPIDLESDNPVVPLGRYGFDIGITISATVPAKPKIGDSDAFFSSVCPSNKIMRSVMWGSLVVDDRGFMNSPIVGIQCSDIKVEFEK